MSNKCRSRDNERGNVLFLILIAAALFAALSYVVTQSSRTGSGDAAREKATLEASEILNYATAVQTAVGRLIINGCNLSNISFENGYDGALHVNPDAPANKTCHVFEPPGGGVAPKKPEAIWGGEQVFYYAGSASVSGIGQDCAAADCADLVMVMHDVNPALCEQLNAANGYQITVPNLPMDTQKACPYKGTMDCNGDDTVEQIFAAPALSGRNSVCYRDTVHRLTFMHAILER